MDLFETILLLLLGATLLSIVARRINVPYPTLLALGGAAVTFLPGMPTLQLPPELILALFVAPVLLDAAYDTSLRDLKLNWRPVLSLVVVAVGLTTVAVAVTTHWLFPDIPWAAAVALGALLAPPDAVAALAVMQAVNPPHRIRKVLEGESLLNDASALLIYKLALSAVAAGSFSLVAATPTFLLVVLGSSVVGWVLAELFKRLRLTSGDPSTVVVLQFINTFALWLLAERLGLSPVVTIVIFGVIISRLRTPRPEAAAYRLPNNAVWDAATFVLNLLAFTLIGLQLAPIRTALPALQQEHLLGGALLILAVVIAVRLVWALIYMIIERIQLARGQVSTAISASSGLVIGWSGMRGIVTLAAAMALPENFPQRDFMLLTAFVVVLGTLVLQGLTLRPLLLMLKLPPDHTIANEANLARTVTLKAATHALDDNPSPEAQRLREDYIAALRVTRQGGDLAGMPENTLRREVLQHSREALEQLRRDGTIGDDAYHQVESELDLLELAAGPGRPG